MRTSTSTRSPRFLFGFVFALSAALGASCDETDHGNGPTCDDSSDPPPDFDAGGTCSFPCLVAHAGDDAGGDTYDTFAAPFFQTYCIRCHAAARTQNCFDDGNPICRNGAPRSANWDDPAAVREHLAHVRSAVGVGDDLFMPPDLPVVPDPEKPAPTCEERYRLTRWIDSGAPGLP